MLIESEGPEFPIQVSIYFVLLVVTYVAILAYVFVFISVNVGIGGALYLTGITAMVTGFIMAEIP